MDDRTGWLNEEIWKAKIVAIESPTIEVRVRTDKSVFWRDIDPIIMFQHELDTIRRQLCKAHNFVEIRWSYVGSLQAYHEVHKA
jgi:hypothetical protein